FDLRPVPAQLAPRDVREFVEDLHTNQTTFRNQRFGSGAARFVGGKSVDQDVGVEEPLTGHLPPPARIGILWVEVSSTHAVAREPSRGCGRVLFQIASLRSQES